MRCRQHSYAAQQHRYQNRLARPSPLFRWMTAPTTPHHHYVRAQLDKAAFVTIWAQGRAMPLDQVVSEA
jgi:hypothetical protein